MQLSLPVIAAAGSVIVPGEAIAVRYALASLVILAGIALAILSKSRRKGALLVA